MATALIFVVGPQTTFGVVSDIDDTVMVTALPQAAAAAWHTFVVNEHARATTLVCQSSTSDSPAAIRSAVHLPPPRSVERRALYSFLSRNLYPAGAADRLGANGGGSAVVASTSAAVWSAWRASSLRSSGCWSVTTGSTMSRSIATSWRNIPTMWRRSAFAS